MKLTIESTTKIVQLEVGGYRCPPVPARIWEGQTESGIPVHCYVTRIAVANDQNHEEFERELKECRHPSAAVSAIDARLVL